MKQTLTEAEWTKVFAARCKSKRGEALALEESALIERAFRLDPERYGKMEPDVFDATVPAGSSAKWKR